VGAEVGHSIMKLWVLSDLHADRGILAIGANPPEFDVFVCAGDVCSGDIAMSIEMVASIARGKPAILVPGNHEWMTRGEFRSYGEIRAEGLAAAARHDVRFLDCDTTVIDGVVFFGTTLWGPLDSRYRRELMALQSARADVVITHFPPPENDLRFALPSGCLWICGHHHGFADYTVAGRRVVRNAVGYGAAEELINSAPAREDFTVEIAT
jgi:hypothetical protein